MKIFKVFYLSLIALILSQGLKAGEESTYTVKVNYVGKFICAERHDISFWDFVFNNNQESDFTKEIVQNESKVDLLNKEEIFNVLEDLYLNYRVSKEDKTYCGRIFHKVVLFREIRIIKPIKTNFGLRRLVTICTVNDTIDECLNKFNRIERY